MRGGPASTSAAGRHEAGHGGGGGRGGAGGGCEAGGAGGGDECASRERLELVPRRLILQSSRLGKKNGRVSRTE
jgi:hypothetical protein